MNIKYTQNVCAISKLGITQWTMNRAVAISQLTKRIYDVLDVNNKYIQGDSTNEYIGME